MSTIEFFEIKQQVKTIEKSWLETIATSQSLRVIEIDYERIVKNNPSDYFELIKTVKTEECLAYTKQNEEFNALGKPK